jgi:hypothetical protein
MSSVHALKTWPAPFEAMRVGRKTFEYRLNDRDFQVGDCLVLQEYNPETDSLTRECLSVRVVYIAAGGQFGIPPKYCVMSVEPWEKATQMPSADPPDFADTLAELASMTDRDRRNLDGWRAVLQAAWEGGFKVGRREASPTEMNAAWDRGYSAGVQAPSTPSSGVAVAEEMQRRAATICGLRGSEADRPAPKGSQRDEIGEALLRAWCEGLASRPSTPFTRKEGP